MMTNREANKNQDVRLHKKYKFYLLECIIEVGLKFHTIFFKNFQVKEISFSALRRTTDRKS